MHLNKLNQIISKLKNYNLNGIKQSLEDEGSSFNDLKIMRKITKNHKINLNIKIGGCEAKNDIFFCKELKVDSIVAPMIESEYALKKYVQCIGNNNNAKLFINLETALALKNLTQIVNSNYFSRLSGLVIGRSDLAGSLNLQKKDVNSKKIYDLVNGSFTYVKKKENKLVLKMGGSITNDSKIFITKLYKKKKINFIETRNVEFKVNNNFLNNISKALFYAFEFEIEWLKIRIKNLKKNSFLKKDFENRLSEMIRRSLNQ